MSPERAVSCGFVAGFCAGPDEHNGVLSDDPFQTLSKVTKCPLCDPSRDLKLALRRATHTGQYY